MTLRSILPKSMWVSSLANFSGATQPRGTTPFNRCSHLSAVSSLLKYVNKSHVTAGQHKGHSSFYAPRLPPCIYACSFFFFKYMNKKTASLSIGEFGNNQLRQLKISTIRARQINSISF